MNFRHLKIFSTTFFVFLTTFLFAYSPQPGDTLDIQVINKKELSTKQQISPDGTISLPLVGRFSVKNKSLEDIDTQLKMEYAKYLQNPVISVQIDQVKKGPLPPSGNFFVSLVDAQKGTIGVKSVKTVSEAMAWTAAQPFQVYRYSENRQKLLLGPNDTLTPGDTVVVSLANTKSVPIYMIFKDQSKNTIELKKAETVTEATSWIAGQHYELKKGPNSATENAAIIEPGDTVILTTGKADDWWGDNWYKVLSGAAVVMGLWNSVK